MPLPNAATFPLSMANLKKITVFKKCYFFSKNIIFIVLNLKFVY